MFSRSSASLIPLALVLILTVSSCSSSGSGAGSSGLPAPALVGDWDFLLVGSESGQEFDPFAGVVPFEGRSLSETWETNFDALGISTINMLLDTNCGSLVSVDYSFNGSAATISGTWSLTQDCNEIQFLGTMFLSFAYNSLTDTVAGTFRVDGTGFDEFLRPFEFSKTGFFTGSRAVRPPVPPPDPGVFGVFTGGTEDVFISGTRGGSVFTLPLDAVDAPNFQFSFDLTGKVLVTITNNSLAFVCVEPPFVVDYTFNGVSGTISGTFFLVGTCNGDLTNVGTFSATFVLNGAFPNRVLGSFTIDSSGADINGNPFQETIIGDFDLTKV